MFLRTTKSDPIPSPPVLASGDEVKALSLTQPWASLVVHGRKRNETRDWGTKYRGWLAIHASSGFPAAAMRVCAEAPFLTELTGLGLINGVGQRNRWLHVDHRLPLGKVLGLVYLFDVQPSESLIVQHRLADNHPNESAFGNYGPGRHIFLFAEPHVFPDPIPAKGSLGLWTWRVP